jgi:hypothetical protein
MRGLLTFLLSAALTFVLIAVCAAARRALSFYDRLHEIRRAAGEERRD